MDRCGLHGWQVVSLKPLQARIAQEGYKKGVELPKRLRQIWSILSQLQLLQDFHGAQRGRYNRSWMSVFIDVHANVRDLRFDVIRGSGLGVRRRAVG